MTNSKLCNETGGARGGTPRIILAFETSCDETCAAVLKVENGTLTVLSNIVSSQIEIHKLYGGVVPEIASRNHAMAVLGVCDTAIKTAGVKLPEITEIAATAEPGLRGAVMVGRVFGSSLADARKIPFTAVNHLAGHIASVAIQNTVNFPFMSLLASGGHTTLYLVKSWQGITPLAQTIDDACGEAFDKVAKILGLEYPGGVKIEALAKQYNGDFIQFVKHPKRGDNFTYSGLKTAVLSYVNSIKNSPFKEGGGTRSVSGDVPQICASFQHEAIMQLVTKTIAMMRRHNVKDLCVCGGVSANGYLRAQMTCAAAEIGATVIFPKFEYCTDNAAMIAAAAALKIKI
jgi:N6-L-threonylcarbamoyladenine synthase